MITQFGSHKILLTASFKSKYFDDVSMTDKEAIKALEKLYSKGFSSFEHSYVNFTYLEDDVMQVVPELLKEYVSSSRGKLLKDEAHPNVYWLKIWMNGNLIMRAASMSDFVQFKVDLNEVVQVDGKVENFNIRFKNGMVLTCNHNIYIC